MSKIRLTDDEKRLAIQLGSTFAEFALRKYGPPAMTAAGAGAGKVVRKAVAVVKRKVKRAAKRKVNQARHALGLQPVGRKPRAPKRNATPKRSPLTTTGPVPYSSASSQTAGATSRPRTRKERSEENKRLFAEGKRTLGPKPKAANRRKGRRPEADSYRLKEAKELSAARTKQRRGKKH